MRVVTAQLAGGERNADRVLIADDAVVVLDGATAFEPVDLDPGKYADAIGREIVRRLPDATINDAVAEAIQHTVKTYNLYPGRSPSSTVSVLRVQEDKADLYVLGDSPIYYGTATAVDTLKDDRIDTIAATERSTYVDALRAGHGYTEQHRQTLVELQRAQQRYRNRSGGYWIAECDPEAAYHGVTRSIARADISWAVIGSDGATQLLELTALDMWRTLVNCSADQLSRLLLRLQQWEKDCDPAGQYLPRAKLHDDKTLMLIREVFPPLI